jgi:hypothetical protein
VPGAAATPERARAAAWASAIVPASRGKSAGASPNGARTVDVGKQATRTAHT